jgi:hypothetical protein
MGDVVFLLLVSIGLMSQDPNCGIAITNAMNSLMSWVLKQSFRDVYILAGLAMVDRRFLPRSSTQSYESFYRIRSEAIQKSLVNVRPTAIVLQAIKRTMNTGALKTLTTDVTFPAVIELAGYSGTHDKAIRCSSPSELLLNTLLRIVPDGELKEIWIQMTKISETRKASKIIALFYVFVYMLTHFVYSLCLYGVGFDKRHSHYTAYEKLWVGLGTLARNFATWDESQLQVIDEPVAEIVISLNMFSRTKKGTIDLRFPVSDYVLELEAMITKLLLQGGIHNVDNVTNAGDIYRHIHSSLIYLHLKAIKTWTQRPKAVRVSKTPKPTPQEVATDQDKLCRAVSSFREQGATIQNIETKLNVSIAIAKKRLIEASSSPSPKLRRMQFKRPSGVFGQQPPDRFYLM